MRWRRIVRTTHQPFRGGSHDACRSRMFEFATRGTPRCDEKGTMARHPAITRRTASWMLVVCALPGVVHGCSTPTDPAPPPGGGQALHLSYDGFAQSVEPVLAQHGCDAGGDCHGGGIRGTLALSPQNAKDIRFDFDQVSLQVSATDPDHSPILTEIEDRKSVV